MRLMNSKKVYKLYSLLLVIFIATGGFFFKIYNHRRAMEQKRIETARSEEKLLAERKAKEEQAKVEEENIKKAEEEARLKTEADAAEKAKAEAEAKAKELENVQSEKPKTQNPPSSGTPQPKPSNPTSPSFSPLPAIPSKYSVEYLTQVENEIVSLCNKERAKKGFGPLSMNETLRKAADYKSNEMLQYNYFEHNSPYTGFKPWDIAQKLNYSYTIYGENIWMTEMKGLDPNNASQLSYYKANITAQNIVTAWMNSEGHRANILNSKFNRIGVGVAYSTCGRTYATQAFSN